MDLTKMLSICIAKSLNRYSGVDNKLGCTFYYSCSLHLNVQNTYYDDAISHEKCNEWKRAMDDEMFALRDHDTFELTSLPPNREPIQGLWVYSEKPNQSEIK